MESLEWTGDVVPECEVGWGLVNIWLFTSITRLCAGWPLTDGAVDGRQPAEPGGEPALQVSVCGPTAAGPLRLRGTDPALLWNLQTRLLPGQLLLLSFSLFRIITASHNCDKAFSFHTSYKRDPIC